MRVPNAKDRKAGKVDAIPESVGAAIDALHVTRERRKKLDAESKTIKQRERELEEAIFSKFKKSDLEGARGRLAQASVEAADVPNLDDDGKFFAHLKKHPEDLDLLQRRLSVEACRARWAEKRAIPGVSIFTRVTLHLSKVKGKK